MGDLSEQTRNLVQHEVRNAQREMRDKLTEGAPALGLAAAATLLGLFAMASAYRLSLRLLEKRRSPAAAALAATLGNGAAAGGVTVLAAQRIRQLPPLFPTETAQQASQAVVETANKASAAVRSE